jgi:hypothetical protein
MRQTNRFLPIMLSPHRRAEMCPAAAVYEATSAEQESSPSVFWHLQTISAPILSVFTAFCPIPERHPKGHGQWYMKCNRSIVDIPKCAADTPGYGISPMFVLP